MTNAELAILSLVAEAPRHGYEIEQVIEARGMREWTEIGFSSIYYLLNRLEKDGMVTSERIPTGGRGKVRRIYQITDAGRTALKEATLTALSTLSPSYPPILLGLANLPILSADQAWSALEAYRLSIEEKMVEVSARLESQRPLPKHVELLFDYSLRMLEAEKVWVEQALEKIKE